MNVFSLHTLCNFAFIFQTHPAGHTAAEHLRLLQANLDLRNEPIEIKPTDADTKIRLENDTKDYTGSNGVCKNSNNNYKGDRKGEQFLSDKKHGFTTRKISWNDLEMSSSSGIDRETIL